MINKSSALISLMIFSLNIKASQPAFSFKQEITEVEVYDFIELKINGKAEQVDNPFTDVNIMGYFTDPAGNKDSIEGFCDEQLGKIYKVRYMPLSIGKYSFRIAVKCQGKTKYFKGNLNVLASGRNGPVRVDSEHPWHFIYEGTGEHYFWNSTTTYWMMGWKDEEIIRDAIELLKTVLNWRGKCIWPVVIRLPVNVPMKVPVPETMLEEVGSTAGEMKL